MFKCKSFDLANAAIAAIASASLSGKWTQIIPAIPADAEFVQAVPLVEQDALRLFFYHDSFDEVDDIQDVPAVDVEITVASGGEKDKNEIAAAWAEKYKRASLVH